MIAANYVNMTVAYEAQQWFVPIYLQILLIEPIIGVCFVLFACFIIIFKTSKINAFFRWGLVESLVFPTILTLYMGLVFKPYVIAPYEIYWSYGHFNTPLFVWLQILIVSTLGCFFVFSLLFLCYVYVKAFVGRGLLHIDKSIKIFFAIGGVFLPAFGIFCTLLEYSSLEEKQEKDRGTVVAGNPNNTMFFTELGGYILNMEGAGVLTYIQFGGIFFFAIAAIVIGLFIFFKIVYTLEQRGSEISAATKKLQKNFILIILVQIYVFIVFYGVPASSVFVLFAFKIFLLANYPIMPCLVIHVMCLPIAYSIMNLTIISQVRQATLKFLRCRRIRRQETSVTVAPRADQATTDATRNTRSTRLTRTTTRQNIF